MVDRFVSAPLELPDGEQPFARADLILYGIDHSGPSFEARVFLDAPDADHASGRADPACAGSLFVFGHGGCFGDAGHCDVVARDDPFDLRPPHALEPALRILTVTEPIRRLVAAGAATTTVTIVAHAVADHPDAVLAFERLRLATYAD